VLPGGEPPGTNLLPDAWQDAAETGVPLWAVETAVAFGFLVITYFTRKGCACPSDSGKSPVGLYAPGRHRRLKEAISAALFGGLETAAAWTTHRAIEGATLALTASTVVVIALMAHSASEGLALAALLDLADRRLAPWLLVACVSPAVGVVITTFSPQPGQVVPVLLVMMTGVLLRTAIIGLKRAAGRQDNGRLSRGQLVIATIAAITVGVLLAMAH
jgi:zinc transporter ZupT